MSEGPSRLAIRGILIAFGTIITEGPIGRFIQRWSDTGARVAWSVLGAAAVALFYGSVVTAGRGISKVFLVALGVLALVMMFVYSVRTEVRDAKTRQSMRLSRRRSPDR